MLSPHFFDSPPEFREWLVENHDRVSELLVGFYKRGSGKPSITWPESVDEALCFGWIDGVRRRVDDEVYTIRFTPRRTKSIWSAVNVRRMGDLIAAERVHPAGLKVYEARDPAKTNLYSFERECVAFSPEFEDIFRANEAAWSFYQSQPSWYRKVTCHWVTTAKKVETRVRRLETLIADSTHGKAIKQLSRRPDHR